MNEEQMPGYAESMREIQAILAELESGNIDIDQLAVKVARAAWLIKNCEQRLTMAETSVQQVVTGMEGNTQAGTAAPDDPFAG